MNYLLNFNDFINESRDDFSKPFAPEGSLSNDADIEDLTDTITVVCVSVNRDDTNEIEHLKNACDANQVRFVRINLSKPENTIENRDGDCILTIGDKSYRVSKDKTIVMKRHARMGDSEVSKKFSLFNRNGFLVINSNNAIATCHDKIKTAEKLKEYGVSQPKFVALNKDNIDNFNEIMEAADFTYPIIAKVNNGTRGNGVFIFESPQSLKGVAQYIISKGDILPSNALIVQEKIESDYDLRIHVMRKERSTILSPSDKYIVYAAMRRNKMAGDYRSNVSLGADYEPHTPKDDEIALALEAARASGCIVCGVDIMRDKNTGKLYVIEINSTPSLHGISEVSEIDPATNFIKNLKEEFEKAPVAVTEKRERRMGHKETFYIDGLDKPLVAFIDSGNTSYTTVLASDVKVNKAEGTVEWVLHGKKFVTKYEGDAKFIAAGGKTLAQPTTTVDLIHNGETFKNVRIKLADKKNRTKLTRDMNVGLKLLTKMNAVIVPSEKYIND